MTPQQTMARFGTPDSIDPARLFRLPPAMQAEGLRMLFDMGETLGQITARTGLSRSEVGHLVDGRIAPFRRDGDSNQTGKEKSE